MDFRTLQQKYKSGLALITRLGYYERLSAEIHLLVKYIDDQLFLKLFSENLFSDIRGVFAAFVRRELKDVFTDMVRHPAKPITYYFEKEYINLNILQKCAVNLHYQLKSLIRMPELYELEFKSSFMQELSRRLNGEIQDVYLTLAKKYKHYFRLEFAKSGTNNGIISLRHLDDFVSHFRQHFSAEMNRFAQLEDAIAFVNDLLRVELEQEIRHRLAFIFMDSQDRLEQLIHYFIEDLKRNFIRTVDRQVRTGRDFEWIQNGFEQFIESDRLNRLMRKVIFQSIYLMRRKKRFSPSEDLF